MDLKKAAEIYQATEDIITLIAKMNGKDIST